ARGTQQAQDSQVQCTSGDQLKSSGRVSVLYLSERIVKDTERGCPGSGSQDTGQFRNRCQWFIRPDHTEDHADSARSPPWRSDIGGSAGFGMLFVNSAKPHSRLTDLW